MAREAGIMSVVFSGSDLINIAIGIERRGITFYDIMAKSADNDGVMAVFEELVEMEREHLKTFQDMLEKADEHRDTGAPAQEYSDYLQALIDNAVFTDDMITSEMATQADSDIKAIELGISAEKDSILFYYEMKDNMPRRTAPIIDRIIAEEKLHLKQLSEIKKKLAAS
jgi:rubrerythrin